MFEMLKRFYNWFVGNPNSNEEGPRNTMKGKWVLADGELVYLQSQGVSPSFECIGGDSPEDPIVLGCDA